jgi:hypothetical protein
MFAKFVCAIALVASTAGTAEAVTWEEMSKATAVPIAKQTSPVFVDEMTPGNWDEAAMERYHSWTIGLLDLVVKNCKAPVLYKVDELMCEAATLLVKDMTDMATSANYWSSPGGRKTWAAKGGK